MLKSTDRGMVIEDIELEHKSGGRSGVWNRPSKERR
jgi:cyclic pyranopterin phosphate synthase